MNISNEEKLRHKCMFIIYTTDYRTQNHYQIISKYFLLLVNNCLIIITITINI
jgi:hypothetical protein